MDRVCVVYVVDKYPHTKVASFLFIFFLIQNANDGYTIYWKGMSLCVWRHVTLWGRSWVRKGEVKAVPIVKDRLVQLGAQRGGKKSDNFTIKRHKRKDPPSPLPSRFQVHRGRNSFKTGNSTPLACLPGLPMSPFRVGKCLHHNSSLWHNHLGTEIHPKKGVLHLD